MESVILNKILKMLLLVHNSGHKSSCHLSPHFPSTTVLRFTFVFKLERRWHSVQVLQPGSHPMPCDYNKPLMVPADMGEKKNKTKNTTNKKPSLKKKSISYDLADSIGYFKKLIYLPSLKVEGTRSRGNCWVEEEATLIYVIFKVFGLLVTLWALKLK